MGARSRARLLISGHSLTSNPIGDYVAQIATAKGDNYNWNQQIINGSPIRARSHGDPVSAGWPGYSQGENRQGSNLNLLREIRTPATLGPGEHYDTLVIAEENWLLQNVRWNGTIEYLRHFMDRVHESNQNTRTFFYNAWLHLFRPDEFNEPASWIDYERKTLLAWECVVSKVNLTLERDKRSDRAINLPTAAALAHLVEQIAAGKVAGLTGSVAQRLDQIFTEMHAMPTYVHLTNLGKYFAAAVIYSAVFGKSPSGAAAPSDLQGRAGAVADFQRIAWEFISDYYQSPNAGRRTMEECRQRLADEVCGLMYTRREESGNTDACKGWMRDGQYFQWPETPAFHPLPAPPASAY